MKVAQQGPAFVLLDRCLLGPYGTEGSNRHRQQDDARHNDYRNDHNRTTAVSANDDVDGSGSKLAILAPTMPDGNS